METDVESAVLVGRKLCLQSLILHIGYLGLGHERVCHRFSCRLAAVLHLQLLGERLAHACHTERHVINLTLLQLERRHDEPVVVTVLAIAILYLCRRLTRSVVLAELPCGSVLIGIDDGEEVKSCFIVEALLVRRLQHIAVRDAVRLCHVALALSAACRHGVVIARQIATRQLVGERCISSSACQSLVIWISNHVVGDVAHVSVIDSLRHGVP